MTGTSIIKELKLVSISFNVCFQINRIDFFNATWIFGLKLLRPQIQNAWNLEFPFMRRSHPGVFCKKVFLKILQNSQENSCARVFTCEFCEIFKNTFFYRTPPVAAFSNGQLTSGNYGLLSNLIQLTLAHGWFQVKLRIYQ